MSTVKVTFDVKAAQEYANTLRANPHGLLSMHAKAMADALDAACSRILKLERDRALAIETLEALATVRGDCMITAKRCLRELNGNIAP